jgi:hypothetical protein
MLGLNCLLVNGEWTDKPEDLGFDSFVWVLHVIVLSKAELGYFT